MALTPAEELELLELLEIEAHAASGRKLDTYFPDDGPLSRHNYPKHMQFFAAGKEYPLRLMLKGNRVGGTESFGCELAYHLTGEYPAWWEGYRFNHPIVAWAAGVTNAKTQEILQQKLFGATDSRLSANMGTGIIPRTSLGVHTTRPGIPGAILTCPIRHISGGWSTLTLKSFEQGLEAFQGNEVHLIWADELMPQSILTECVVRITPTTTFEGGMIAWTVTPEHGVTEAILEFLADGQIPEKPRHPHFAMLIGWDDAPHLSEDAKQVLAAGIPVYQLDARSKGIPVLGAGLIYPIPEEQYTVEPFEIPKHWPRAFAMDVGWEWTAGLWGAWDQETDTVYFYHAYKSGQEQPSVHAQAFKAPGEWIPGVHDPAARQRSQIDGRRLSMLYQGLGLTLYKANNAVEAGIYECLEALSQGGIKIFATLQALFAEMRLYRRDEKGKVIKVNDHLMDCMRYWILSAKQYARQKPVDDPMPDLWLPHQRGNAWMV